MRVFLVLMLCFGVLTACFAGPSERQLYSRSRAKLRAAHAYSVDIWKLDENGKNAKFDSRIVFDRKRGYRIEDSVGALIVCDGKRVWERGKGISKHSKEDGPDMLELNVGPATSGITSWGLEPTKVTFDGRQCYATSPMYGEHIMIGVTLYFDLKTGLVTGYTETQQGNWALTYSYRNLKLNPKIPASRFEIPD